MKKLLLLHTFCAASLTVHAQDGVYSQGSPIGARSSADNDSGKSGSHNNGFGIKAGFNLTSLHGKEKGAYKDLESLKTYHAGAYAQFRISDKFSFQPEILFSRKGFKAQSFDPMNGQPSGIKEETRLNYLQVPLLLVYNITDNISVHAGPQHSTIMSIRYQGQEHDVSNAAFGKLEYGVVGGIEARIGPARLGARYDLGLSDIYNNIQDLGVGYGAYDRVKNSVFQVYLGIGFSK